MGKTNKKNKHFMDETFEMYRKIRKPAIKKVKVIKSRKDDELSRKWDWKSEIDSIR